eukprot:11097076-Ditylum_brightwellii.AAC.1
MFTTFGTKIFYWSGLLPVSLGKEVDSALNAGIEGGVPEHSCVVELQKHSKFVHFLVSVWSIFLEEFARHEHRFPEGCGGEAMFAGS